MKRLKPTRAERDLELSRRAKDIAEEVVKKRFLAQSAVVVDPYSDLVGSKKPSVRYGGLEMVRFVFNTADPEAYLDVQMRPDGIIDIRAGRSLALSPRASNAVSIEVQKP